MIFAGKKRPITTTQRPPDTVRIDKDTADEFQQIIDKFNDSIPDDSTEDLLRFPKLLKDLLKSLLNKNGGKNVIPKLRSTLQHLEDSYPHMSDLFKNLDEKLKSLQDGRHFNVDGFLNTLQDVLYQIRRKGNQFNNESIIIILKKF